MKRLLSNRTHVLGDEPDLALHEVFDDGLGDVARGAVFHVGRGVEEHLHVVLFLYTL